MAATMFLGFSYPMGIVAMLYDRKERNQWKSQDKLEIRICHLVHKIAMKFQRYYLVFGVQPSNGNSVNIL